MSKKPAGKSKKPACTSRVEHPDNDEEMPDGDEEMPDDHQAGLGNDPTRVRVVRKVECGKGFLQVTCCFGF